MGGLSISGIDLKTLDQQEALGLERAFLEEEVFSASSNLSGDKVLGPNGSTMAFWQFSWDFIKDKVMGFFSNFFANGKFESLNTTFLDLIPKKGCVEDLKDFRPISFVGGLYKLLAKCWQID